MPLPELIEIVPLAAPVRAEITVPGSKSITNRALILAALADGETTLRGALWSEDTQVMVGCLQELGFMVNVAHDPDEVCNRTITVYGKGGEVPRGGTAENPLELFVGNAGTAARFLAAFVCLGSGVYRLDGVPRMRERPQAALFAALRQLGYRVESENENDKLPARISGVGRPLTPSLSPGGGEGGRRPGEGEAKRSCAVSVEESSQFASALLLCADVGAWQVEVTGANEDEMPYVTMTRELVTVFPKRGGEFQIEPDASSGSYLLGVSRVLKRSEWVELLKPGTVGVVANPSDVRVSLWPKSQWQVDALFERLNLFPHRPMKIEELDLPQRISRRKDLGDSIMTVIALSPLLTTRVVRFTDLGRLRVQECERVVALRTELTKCGAKVVEEGDTLTVFPSPLHGAEIETYNDHRMAMCFAVLGLKVPGIKIKNPACVKKTFPNFFQKLAAPPPRGLGATILDGHTGRKLAMEELFAE
ncbi:MAG: 3-phosphoshikimate 1-carboxyvinyltransferase [Verrucomicrobia bacterium]|nr:3-phosphoshikimate 1-carboxyvinyltransferase [Verrucomicrobiota bacterium]